MHELGGLEGPHQRPWHPAMNWYRLSAQLRGVERVLHALVNRNIASNDGDGLDLDIGMLHRHYQGDGIV
jgi:hypothetical protein